MMNLLKNFGVALLGAFGILIMIGVDPMTAFNTSLMTLIVSIIQIITGIICIVTAFYLTFYHFILDEIEKAEVDELL